MANYYIISNVLYGVASIGMLMGVVFSWLHDMNEKDMSQSSPIYISRSIMRVLEIFLIFANIVFVCRLRSFKFTGTWKYCAPYFWVATLGPIAVSIMDPTVQAALVSESTTYLKGAKYAAIVSSIILFVMANICIFTSRRVKTVADDDE